MDDPAIQPIVVRGCRIALRRAGSGPPMLILHGAADADTWLACLTELAADHDVILPEHPGFGASDTPDWLDTIADLANFYLEFLDQLDLTGVDLVGHDLGGWIAAELAVSNPRIIREIGEPPITYARFQADPLLTLVEAGNTDTAQGSTLYELMRLQPG